MEVDPFRTERDCGCTESTAAIALSNRHGLLERNLGIVEPNLPEALDVLESGLAAPAAV
jgi:hypothetical protein